MRYFDIEKFPRYDILSNEILRYFQNIEILPSAKCSYIWITLINNTNSCKELDALTGKCIKFVV